MPVNLTALQSLTFEIFRFYIHSKDSEFFTADKSYYKQPHTESTSQKQAYPFSFGKTFNSVLKNSRKIIYRVCEVANVKKQMKAFQSLSTSQRHQNHNIDNTAKECDASSHSHCLNEQSRYIQKLAKLNKFLLLILHR